MLAILVEANGQNGEREIVILQGDGAERAILDVQRHSMLVQRQTGSVAGTGDIGPCRLSGLKPSSTNCSGTVSAITSACRRPELTAA